MPHSLPPANLGGRPASSAASQPAAKTQPDGATPPSSEDGGAGGGSTAAEDGSEGGSEAGEGMGALGELFDDTNEQAADALVFGAAEADYEQEDWGWSDLNAAAAVPGNAGPGQTPGERPLSRILLPS